MKVTTGSLTLRERPPLMGLSQPPEGLKFAPTSRTSPSVINIGIQWMLKSFVSNT